MFGGLVNLITPSTIGPPPEDIPPPTPLTLPRYNPQHSGASSGKDDSRYSPEYASLVKFLQSIQRPTELREAHFAALGVHVHTDVAVEDLLPDPSYAPSASGWDRLTVDEAPSKDATFRRPLSNGNMSPEARVFMERRHELSLDNQAAFRTVRRIRPDPGTTPVRLGNCYEFYRQLELMAAYWDDTSLSQRKDGHLNVEKPASPPRHQSLDGSLEQTTRTISASTTQSEANSSSRNAPDEKPKPQQVTYRTAPGNLMPPELRHSLITAFVKLVSYDFGCNVSPSRVEPRLHLLEPPAVQTIKGTPVSQPQRASYFPSGCVFVFRIPTTREAARTGIVEGPILAVSARNTINFNSPADHKIDFARELVAALVAAQHRAREGKEEKRFGDGEWWATAKRWGGGQGGLIGREIESDGVVGDKDARPDGGSSSGKASSDGAIAKPSSSGSSSRNPPAVRTPGLGHVSPVHPISHSSGLPMRGLAPNKKTRKNMSMYDNYRMVRLPSSNWDRKARYRAIGKRTGADYDDVFVVSSLFHHICVLRTRVPTRLLDVMAGAPEEDQARSWDKVEMWRSRWFDLFLVEERLEALRLVWGVMAWMMRKEGEGEGEKKGKDGEDLVMKGT
ncbi:uncharacterized protein BCR38DRAFT_442853 [Pseudomassariella vexata]|uniref:Uncharacterized protein n=1 Tax=Pseudomassariella vexata TaxID=1141098 RepID=A0A1Y2DQH2_9PEZI|nr:uncharacterized protein BCR38DRAFT_442853 [Pseudomassariella vexata]ORY60905.1 hypothetical protein BCR38DRAFT_442853 [Pseudomassariella vexata]